MGVDGAPALRKFSALFSTLRRGMVLSVGGLLMARAKEARESFSNRRSGPLPILVVGGEEVAVMVVVGLVTVAVDVVVVVVRARVLGGRCCRGRGLLARRRPSLSVYHPIWKRTKKK